MLEPFVGHDRHRLRQIERGEGRIDRQRYDLVGERDLLVFEAGALAPEQDADALARRDARRRDLRRRGRIDHGLGLVVYASGGGEDQRAVGDSRLDAVEELRLFEDAVGARGHLAGLRVGPGLARPDQSKPPQPEIGHGARRRPDVLAELRLDQDHDRSGLLNPRPGLVGPGAWHGFADWRWKAERLAYPDLRVDDPGADRAAVARPTHPPTGGASCSDSSGRC
jgi:hypothetical protein